MIWVKVFSRTCARDKCESLHSWSMWWPCTNKTSFWKRSREATPNWGLWSITSSSINSRTCWFPRRSAQETEQQFTRSRRKRPRLSILDVKRVVLERRTKFFWNWLGKERAGQRTSTKKGGPTRQLFQQNHLMPEKQESPSRKEDRPSCFNYNNEKL